MSALERFFRPIYWFLMAVGYTQFFLCMLPGAAAAFLLGRCGGAAVLNKFVLKDRWRRPDYRSFFRSYGWRWTLAAVVWDTAALAVSVLLGCFNGWWIVYAPKGQILGGLLAAGCFLLGRVCLPRFKKDKEV